MTDPQLELHPLRGVAVFSLILLPIVFFLWMRVSPALATDGSTLMKSVIIQDKAPGVIIVNRDRYEVTDATLIRDILGRQIPLCDLPVPCEADLEYQETEGPYFLCLVIEIRRLLTGADTQGKSGRKD